MMLARWQPFPPVWREFQKLQNEMNRLLDRFAGDGERSYRAVAYPPLNLWEDGDHIYIEAELPGLDLKDLEIQVTDNNQLSIKGERKVAAPEKCVWHRQERGYGQFARVLTLPFPIDTDQVDARLENGVLHLKLAKHASAKPRKIQVKAD